MRKRRCTAVDASSYDYANGPYRCRRTLTGDGRAGLCYVHQRQAMRQPVRVTAYGGGSIRIMLTNTYKRAVVMYDSRQVVQA